MTDVITKTAEDLYREYQDLIAIPYANPLARTPEEQARDDLSNSLWELYESTTELEVLTLLSDGDKSAAMRMERLFEVRNRVRKDLQHDLTVKKAVAALDKGEPEALNELLSKPTYRRVIASYEGTPPEVLEQFFTEVCGKGATRRSADIYHSLAVNPALSVSDLDRLISKARDEEDYRLLIEHPNLTEAQFARIAHKNPRAALMRNAGLTLTYLKPYKFHLTTNKYEDCQPVQASDKVMRRVLAAAARSEQHDLSLWAFLDERSTTAIRRTALTNCLPRLTREEDGSVRYLRTLPQRFANLTSQVIAKLEPEVRAMLVLYPHTPKRVLSALREAGVRRDVVLVNSKFPARGIDYDAYFTAQRMAA